MQRLLYNIKRFKSPFVYLFLTSIVSFFVMIRTFSVSTNLETFEAYRAEITEVKLNEDLDVGLVYFNHEGTYSWISVGYIRARNLRIGDPLRVYYSEKFDWYRSENSGFFGTFAFSVCFFVICGILCFFMYQPLPK